MNEIFLKILLPPTAKSRTDIIAILHQAPDHPE
jgi:hypothetical protein